MSTKGAKYQAIAVDIAKSPAVICQEDKSKKSL